MRLAYFTPLNPVKSGISDFAEELLPFLAANNQIELFVDDFTPQSEMIRSCFLVHDIKEYDQPDLRSSFDLAIFQVGNNYDFHKNIVDAFMRYGGILELHDMSLHHFVAAQMLDKGKVNEYRDIINYCHGNRGLSAVSDFFSGKTGSLWETYPLEFPVNKHLIDIADAIIVHSDFARQMIVSINNSVPVTVIPLGTSDIVDDPAAYKSFCRKSLQIGDDKYIIGSFGLATPTKRIVETLIALDYYKQNCGSNFIYYIVGGVSGIDIYKIINERNLKENVVVTGFLDLNTFKLYMGACDFCINLRYPTQGESSAALHRILGMGKPVIVTDIGSFAEYPVSVACKIPYGEEEIPQLVQALCEWTSKASVLEKMSKVALDYARKNFAQDVVSNKYGDFFEKILTGTVEPDMEDIYINRLISASHSSARNIDALLSQKAGRTLDTYQRETALRAAVLPQYLLKKSEQLAEMDFDMQYVDHFADTCQIFAVH